jgi:hypothetical protein
VRRPQGRLASFLRRDLPLCGTGIEPACTQLLRFSRRILRVGRIAIDPLPEVGEQIIATRDRRFVAKMQAKNTGLRV